MNLSKNLFRLFIIGFFVLNLLFYKDVILNSKLPIPSDTIVGLYHPYRDLLANEYPRGIPFKNFLITDPVRQTYIWKELAVEQISRFELPLWNPYEMTGKPLLGNFQSSPFYPLNIIFLIKPFYISWSIFIITQTVLAGIFMFIYLRSLRLSYIAAFLAALAWSFSGFSIAWLEWGTILATGMWLPLILFCIDKIIYFSKSSSYFNKSSFLWGLFFVFSVSSSFLAGNLQIFFYIASVSFLYLLSKLIRTDNKSKLVLRFGILTIVIGFITSIQLFQTMFFIINSARSLDRFYLDIDGWFYPLQNFIQFFAPDYFGNPATGNYWGVWNYGELTGYLGIFPLFFALTSVFVKRKLVFFYGSLLFLSSLFMIKNIISELPFVFSIPFISSAQPTRLIFIVIFSLCVLSAFGCEYILKSKNIKSKIVIAYALFIFVLGLVWLITSINYFSIDSVSRDTSIRNLILPTLLVIICGILVLGISIFNKIRIKQTIILVIIVIAVFDLFRFGYKFTPFTNHEYLFPSTKIIDFLQSESQTKVFRIATLNDEILPPNFATYYRIQSVSGYDPLYLKNYAELISAVERGNPDIREPYGFNRIINPKNYSNSVFNLLNVKYILTFQEINNPRYKLVMSEGKTKLYEDLEVLPRVFFVENVIPIKGKQEQIDNLFSLNESDTAVIESDVDDMASNFKTGQVIISNYSDNLVELQTSTSEEGFLVLLDAYYPLWNASVDGKNTVIYKTNHAFRGVLVPAGKHKVIFEMRLL